MKICKKCGTEVTIEKELDYEYYCSNCDENLYEFEVLYKKSSFNHQELKTMMTTSCHCSEKMDDENNFCSECEEKGYHHCESCGKTSIRVSRTICLEERIEE
ncbi:hypothetical protein QTG56_24205 (plasmid) [Rossellomorea sp. AcN35-11]|nr:hypothetical protein [Rossellomorea aquimaris]WJV31743.1 hypothetical protein QTG56_24205 [Rossellomorea sp. AcN35-11]